MSVSTQATKKLSTPGIRRSWSWVRGGSLTIASSVAAETILSAVVLLLVATSLLSAVSLLWKILERGVRGSVAGVGAVGGVLVATLLAIGDPLLFGVTLRTSRDTLCIGIWGSSS